MNKTLIVAAIVGTASIIGVHGAANAEDKDKCVYVYEGKHSKLGFGETVVCWSPAPGFLKIEDTSIKHPEGGRNSLPNELHRKVIKKPVRWARDRLGW